MIAASGLFDPAWYLERYSDVRGREPLTHYLQHGGVEGRDPHPVFDGTWYLEQNPDVRAAGANPLVHYLRRGAAEGRSPHVLFDPGWYLNQNPDVRAAGVNPLVHYLTNGAFDGRDPHPLFDSDWYLDAYPDIRAAGFNPLVHYLKNGASEGREPSLWFSTASFLTKNPDVAATGVNPLVHYVRLSTTGCADLSDFFTDVENYSTSHRYEGPRLRPSPGPLDRHLLQYRRQMAVACGERDKAYASIALRGITRTRDTFKPIAFYLPQMHAIPENDRAWGMGFTEWTNVSKATPQFIGHYQPRFPGELGFYDLRRPEVMLRQIELAKLYGLHAFCFHYYWFGGRRLLERPLDMFVSDRSMNFNFCLCWANENWTKKWDGCEDEVIIAQKHSKEDHAAVFDDLLRYIRDDRYVCVDGRPVIVIYRPDIIAELDALVEIWRNKAAAAGLPGVYLVATNSFGFTAAAKFGFDALCQFPPHGLNVGRIDGALPRLNPEHWGFVYNYKDVVATEAQKLRLPPSGDLPRFPGLMPAWDNEPRRPGNGNVFHGSTPGLFHAWLTEAARHVHKYYPPEQRFVFINAWNEWAEGAYLEPDHRFGYAYLSALRRVVEECSITPEPLPSLARSYNDNGRAKTCDTVACLHLFYTSLVPAFAAALAQAKQTRPMDVIVSIPNTWTEADFDFVVKQMQPIRIIVTENVGRDVWPFVQVLRLGQQMGYTLGCKIHSKMSTHLTDGAAWRSRLVESLLTPAALSALEQSFFAQPRVGLAAAKESFHTLKEPDTVLNNLANMEALMDRLGVTDFAFDEFVAGSMFWFRFAAFEHLALSSIERCWFDEELGQIDGTVAHAFERLFVSYARAADWTVLKY